MHRHGEESSFKVVISIFEVIFDVPQALFSEAEIISFATENVYA
jgi:hypothetical protein